eukprot:TRINITY_DN30143_c0_g2_i1.p1 TRINITY_DN30143_c0_g2~~TRINITY_DN30143_c0_g2_i1.p1  ORF type:complete len:356 (+),score=59.43 TRINITY_DN30143_c0_g2_i1:95-1162(+)
MTCNGHQYKHIVFTAILYSIASALRLDSDTDEPSLVTNTTLLYVPPSPSLASINVATAGEASKKREAFLPGLSDREAGLVAIIVLQLLLLLVVLFCWQEVADGKLFTKKATRKESDALDDDLKLRNASDLWWINAQLDRIHQTRRVFCEKRWFWQYASDFYACIYYGMQVTALLSSGLASLLVASSTDGENHYLKIGAPALATFLVGAENILKLQTVFAKYKSVSGRMDKPIAELRIFHSTRLFEFFSNDGSYALDKKKFMEEIRRVLDKHEETFFELQEEVPSMPLWLRASARAYMMQQEDVFGLEQEVEERKRLLLDIVETRGFAERRPTSRRRSSSLPGSLRKARSEPMCGP